MKYLVLVFFILMICGIILQFQPKGYITEKKAKKYIIKHKDKIKLFPESFKHIENSTTFLIDSCEIKYFDNISIRYTPFGQYSIIFWGNRSSWQWSFRRDKDFDIYMIENKNPLDVEIHNIIQNKLKELK